MSPNKLIIALWAVVALVALAIVLAPSNDGYREFASTQVAPTVKVAQVAVEVPLATEKSSSSSTVATAPAAAPAAEKKAEAAAPAAEKKAKKSKKSKKAKKAEAAK